MPGVVLFKRRWGFASDDLVFPGIFEIFVRTVWLIVIAAVFHVNRSTLDCDGGHILKAYYIGTLVLLVVSLIHSLIIVYTSMQGTITNVRPRRRIPMLLYIKLIITIPELSWTILGTYWAFGKSYGCDREIVWTVKALVICGWFAFLFVLISLIVLFDPLGRKTFQDQTIQRQCSLVSGDGEQFMVGASSAATRLWEKRCKILCCCVGCDERSQSVFSDIAKLMTQFFQDVDLVPTDVGAGLILLHYQHACRESKLTEVVAAEQHSTNSSSLTSGGRTQSEEITQMPSYMNAEDSSPLIPGFSSIGPCTSFDYVLSTSSPVPPIAAISSSRPPLKSWMTLPLVTHYMKYAMASYGWPLYVFANLCTGVCQLYPHCRCCNCLYGTGSVLKDNTCQCNTAAIQKFTGVKGQDIIYASFHNRIYEIPFFVLIDRENNDVVISIRGTMSLKDALTDLTLECDTLNIEGVSDCYAHKGILSAASYIYTQVTQLHLLEEAFNKGQDLGLVVCGHSLGAGAAVLLATLLRPKYPHVRCYAYSPPGGLMSPSLSRYSLDYVISTVLGEDFIPRLSLVTLEDLKLKLLTVIGKCHHPKYKVLLGGCWRVLCGVSGNTSNTSQTDASRALVENSQSPSATSYTTAASNSPEALRDAIMSSSRTRITQPPLVLPGQVLHIVEVQGSKSWCGTPQYSAVWSCQEVFDEILVGPKMISDHLPDALMRALDQLNQRHFSPIRCV